MVNIAKWCPWPVAHPKRMIAWHYTSRWDEEMEAWRGWSVLFTPYTWKLVFDWQTRELRIGPLWWIGRAIFDED